MSEFIEKIDKETEVLEDRVRLLLGEDYSQSGVADCFKAMVVLRGFDDVDRILDRLESELEKASDKARVKKSFLRELFEDFN